MLAAIRLTGSLLLGYWPSLLAWFLFGMLGRYAAVEFAGFIGAHHATAGVLLLPLAVLARLISFIAMLLVLREGMSQLRGSVPRDKELRRKEFFAALFAGILPFVAFYTAQGYLAEDVTAYLTRLLEVNSGIQMMQLVESLETGAEVTRNSGPVGELVFSPLTVSIIIIAFVLRLLWGRYRERLPNWLAIAAVYLEVLWIYFSATLIAQVISWVPNWVATRQGTTWVNDLRADVGEWFSPLLTVWDMSAEVVTVAAKVTLEPLAWLAIAGVVYGQAMAAQGPAGLRARYAVLPSQLRKRMEDLSSGVVSRFRPISRALVLMWRAGPALIGLYILLYTVVLLLERLILILITRLFGPQDIFAFWMVADTLLFLLIPFLIEPLRVTLVASAYDSTLARLKRQAAMEEKEAEAEVRSEETADPTESR